MKKILMCEPVFFDVDYEINPWMTGNLGSVDVERAKQQWFVLYNKLRETEDIYFITPEPGLPDMVFTANAGLVRDNFFYPSNFKCTERKPERNHWINWFLDKGYFVKDYAGNKCFEGEGDVLKDSNKLDWVGYGFRSDKYSNAYSVYHLELVDPRWYHLDTAFCPLENNGLLWYPGAFSEDSRKIVRSSFSYFVEVDKEDALMFACNAIVIEDRIYIPKNNSTSKKLEDYGYKVFEFEMGEFMKSGGACKCLTLFI